MTLVTMSRQADDRLSLIMSTPERDVCHWVVTTGATYRHML